MICFDNLALNRCQCKLGSSESTVLHDRSVTENSFYILYIVYGTSGAATRQYISCTGQIPCGLQGTSPKKCVHFHFCIAEAWRTFSYSWFCSCTKMRIKFAFTSRIRCIHFPYHMQCDVFRVLQFIFWMKNIIASFCTTHCSWRCLCSPMSFIFRSCVHPNHIKSTPHKISFYLPLIWYSKFEVHSVLNVCYKVTSHNVHNNVG